MEVQERLSGNSFFRRKQRMLVECLKTALKGVYALSKREFAIVMAILKSDGISGRW